MTTCQPRLVFVSVQPANVDFRSEETHINVLDRLAKKQYATVARVAGAGHLVGFQFYILMVNRADLVFIVLDSSDAACRPRGSRLECHEV